ncbi:MAG TPA: N-acetyl-alpha-D-glucosaminyl L-malate synthase BshA, partial [Desulfobacterales bacterium]|nr:N-acetyl-alpha-D-glucosaminyl L-malate synthase BshA [Desulfobacterales bacterium]
QKLGNKGRFSKVSQSVMKIGIMCHSSCGGSTRIATEMAKELSRRGHRVNLFTQRVPFGYGNSSNGVVLHTTTEHKNNHHPAYLYTSWTDKEIEAFKTCVLKVVATDRLDVLHFHYAVPFGFIAKEIKQRLDQIAPLLVGTLHGTDVSVYGNNPVKGQELAQALRHMDALTTVSANHARLSEDVFGLHKPPEVISNFVDLLNFCPHIAKKADSKHRPRPRIAYISNFRPVKDPKSMAHIYLDIRKQIDSELWLIGDGPEMEEVKTILENSNFGNDVTYWGIQKQVAPILSQTDLLLLTSLYESFSLTALEAMACGVPVVAPKVGGIPEVVIDGKTGFLYPAGAHSHAVYIAVELLSNPEIRNKTKNRAILHSHNFDINKVVSVYEKFYLESISMQTF